MSFKRARSSSRDSSSSDASSTSRPKKKKTKTKKSAQREAGSKLKRSPAPAPLPPLGPPLKKRGRGRPRKDESLGPKGRAKGDEGAVRPVYAQAGTPILEAGALGKLIILVEDFYYGTDPTCRLPEVPERPPGLFKCIPCDQNFLKDRKSVV